MRRANESPNCLSVRDEGPGRVRTEIQEAHITGLRRVRVDNRARDFAWAGDDARPGPKSAAACGACVHYRDVCRAGIAHAGAGQGHRVSDALIA
jgi:hypothetical protein